jgi:hypothetical protein
MLSVGLNASAGKELAALQGVLERYHAVSKRDVADTLAHKANDIRIKLFQGYWEQRWKGSRKGSEGVAFRQMRARAKAGLGIHLRVLGPSPSAPTMYYQRRTLRGAHGSARRLRVPVRMSDYQRRVWTELARRQAGIGVLGVAFLLQRWRYNSQGRRLAVNRTTLAALEVQTQVSKFSKETLGILTLAPTFARIEGFVPGQAEVGDRHSILEIALRDVREDTEHYLAMKTAESIFAELEAAGFAVS